MAREFKGTIKEDIRDSMPDWDAFLDTKAPAEAPNVLVILYDDTGQAAWSPYGGRIIEVIYDVADDVYLDAERQMAAALARD
jgi:hypothetical protein